MTIEEVLAQVDELKPNQYDDGIKISWLSKLDEKIFKEVIKRYIPDENTITEFTGYGINDLAKELLADDAYSDMYIDYCFAMIDYVNQELDRYANSMAMFNTKYNDYTDYYNRTHTMKTSKLKIW